MMVVFEVFVAPGASPDGLLSEELKRETGAQVMTIDEARKVGFSGIPEPAGREVRLIAVRKRDAPWIHRTLETNEAVASFRVHEVD
jgi:hypothetical protein